MAGPSELQKNEVRCKGKLKTGKRKGSPCRGLLVAEDGTIACHNCGESRHILDVLDDAVKQGIIAEEVAIATIEKIEGNQGRRREKMVKKSEKSDFEKGFTELLTMTAYQEEDSSSQFGILVAVRQFVSKRDLIRILKNIIENATSKTLNNEVWKKRQQNAMKMLTQACSSLY